ncbi:MAG: 2-succinyl-5-enolpyruvyl-6-hydroxy-3-cyclohexene-1-carboxylic-acid synthase [Opitutales bacterium]|jgi:2-succinyl-5-enolpyruvyl-6-hydroxy-3-cyclohexene-1-carboxylate synthase
MNQNALTNTNSLWGHALAETLARLGVRHAVVSPGSRSTPIIWALTHCHGIETIPLLDERGAAFFALGLARQGGRPVVLACTSGSAAANYLPAVVEAHESGAPLLVLTADRPPELRRCAAGQAIDQTRMFGQYANEHFELPVPEPTMACLRQLRQTLSHAIRLTMLPARGPVHINCPLREPLAPEPGKTLTLDFDPYVLLKGVAPENFGYALPDFDGIAPAGPGHCGLIVAGTQMADDDEAARSSLWSLAVRSGYPVLCEALGPWRAGEVPKGLIRVSAYGEILKDAAAREALKPDFVLQVGPLPTSKALRQWLEALDTPTLICSTGHANLDPLHRRARQICFAPELLHLLPLPAVKDGGYSALWAEAETQARAKLNAALDETAMSEGGVARELFRHLRADCRLFVANSMSARHAEQYAECGHEPFRVHFSRGANGIDGTLATALGMAHGGRGVLLTGDLALLHDASSMMAARQLRGHLSIVMVDNGGGGIFRHMPVADIPDRVFERYFLTPQNVDYVALCDAYGTDYQRIDSFVELRANLANMPADGVRLLHVKVTG